MAKKFSILFKPTIENVGESLSTKEEAKMEPSPSQQNTQNEDASCRLRHGLNNHCLAEIFQYLRSVDLYTVSGMNEFYTKIINDLIIPDHSVNFYKLFEKNITISQVFERFGRKMRKCFFYCDPVRGDDSIEVPNYTIDQFIQLITLYCSPDQLKNVRIATLKHADPIIVLPNYFRKVEKFQFFSQAYEKVQLSVSFTESLRYLVLENIKLDPNFDWKMLKNLTKLFLSRVEGVNESNFIEYLRQRPSLEAFGHSHTFDISSMENIFEKMAEYCGNQIRALKIYNEYSKKVDNPPGFYHFISGFKNLKEVYLRADLKCGDDLIDPIKRLAEHNTIEDLSLTYTGTQPHRNCIFREMPNRSAPNMKPFTNMKTVRIFWDYEHLGSDKFDRQCAKMKLLNTYSSQILANAETLIIDSARDIREIDWNFIKSALKLRQLFYLDFHTTEYQTEKLIQIVSGLESILQNRKDENINDAIELKVHDDDFTFELFNKIIKQSSSIKLSKASGCDRSHLKNPLRNPCANKCYACL